MPHQVNLAIGSKDRSVGWYDPPITSVEGPIRDLLENYSHVPSDEVISRIVETVRTHIPIPSHSPKPLAIPLNPHITFSNK